MTFAEAVKAVIEKGVHIRSASWSDDDFKGRVVTIGPDNLKSGSRNRLGVYFNGKFSYHLYCYYDDIMADDWEIVLPESPPIV